MTNLHRTRKSSALLSTAAGVSVCLSGGGAAHAVSGNITASNPDTHFASGEGLRAFDQLASWFLTRSTTQVYTCTMTWSTQGSCFTDITYYGGTNQSCTTNTYTHTNCRTTTLRSNGLNFRGSAGSPAINGNLFVNLHSAGVSVNAGMAGGFIAGAKMRRNANQQYLAVRFNASGTRYGWLHVVSSDGLGDSAEIDKWGYDATGGNIKTLAPSVQLRELPLADGRIQLRWNNADESGVARYEVQQRGSDGVWTTAESSAPGAGRYAVALPRAGEYRVLVEKTDGSTEQL